MKPASDVAAWQEAKRRCRLSDEEVRMAKELGFQAKALIGNIPSPSQKWKAPVGEWVRSIYERKVGEGKIGKRKLASRRPAGNVSPQPAAAPRPAGPGEERRTGERPLPDNPWPDDPEIPDLPPIDLGTGFPDDEFADTEWNVFDRPIEEEIAEEEILMLRRQRLFRWAAQAVAVAVSELPAVEKVVAFGAASQPLKKEVPRFRRLRRDRIEIPHECGDLDLAVWLNDLTRLGDLKNAMARGLALTQDTPYGGVAHHQVDVHVFDSAGEYRGRLCIFGQCPKQGKAECHVPGCGAQPFLRQFEDYRFKPAVFAAASKVVLFDRSVGFRVALPRIDAGPQQFEDIPF